MNKKFLSAILFGALMVSSTGTFVSCKDYDDDIKDLQEQIDKQKTAYAIGVRLVGSEMCIRDSLTRHKCSCRGNHQGSEQDCT